MPDGDVTAPMAAIRRSVLLAPVLLAAIVAACGGSAASLAPSATPTPSESTAPSGPLVTVETRGGECPQGACGGTTVVERDGRVHATAPEPAELGTVPPEALALLVTEIDQADFEALASTPFTGECPVNVDGQELIFTFETAGGPVRLASCEVVVDLEGSLFAAVANAIAAAQ